MKDPIAIGAGGAAHVARQFGLGGAIASTVFGVLYLFGLQLNLAASGSPYPTGADVRAISAGIALAWNIVLLILFAALRREAEPSRSFLAELGWVFAIQVRVVSCVSWFLGLTSSTLLAQGGTLRWPSWPIRTIRMPRRMPSSIWAGDGSSVWRRS